MKNCDRNCPYITVTAHTHWGTSHNDRIEFELNFGDGEPMKITFLKKDEEFFTDERDDAFGYARWVFFAPELDCDTEALGYLREWFETTPYMEIFKELDLDEGHYSAMPSARFSKGDMWNYFHDVLILVERTAMNV